jgi:hypothetical protein
MRSIIGGRSKKLMKEALRLWEIDRAMVLKRKRLGSGENAFERDERPIPEAA